MILDTNSYKVLIVEDNLGDFLLVEDYLLEHIKNPELVHAKKFKELLKFFEEGQYAFDVILLDLSLPDISKEKLIEEAKILSQSIPVIILTGYADLEFATKSLSIGISDYLVKDTINSLVLYKSILYSLQRHRFLQSLRESEKRYMDLFHLSPAPMWVFDLETLAFLDVNEAAIRHYGHNKEEFLSMSIKDIRPTEDIRLLEEAIRFSKENTASFYRGFFRHKKKDGSIIDVEIVSNSINYNGIQAELILATDITEKRLYMNAIEEQNKKLKEIAWSQSHVVRAPVARLMGLIDLIKNGDIDQTEKDELLGDVLTSAEEIDGIIKDIVKKSQSVIDIENK